MTPEERAAFIDRAKELASDLDAKASAATKVPVEADSVEDAAKE